ncbi:hypothetical protein GGQ88_002643 [Novosphingobium hassiacum]|uniref:Uncharacterized protein n=1 Tax=Novosphingobium hassiacum TaxID=173676 RepID=A0A7W5ZZE3_9SPHN|nr:hypothetical protein [Novosphingobium hassiacum]MBB3861359.1 hypothetical protein [Novosphingobium hassiacum]
MITSANRLRSVGWFVLLGLCFTLVLVLAFRVNALRSRVHHAEEKIVALKQEKLYLETEFETRANQQQLKAWNDVEFGYAAPGASQYLEGERQLASLSMPSTPDAPAPIRVASMDDSVIASAAFPAMVSPLSGKALASGDRKAGASDDDADDGPRAPRMGHAEAVETLNDRLGKVVEVSSGKPVRAETTSDKPRPVKAVKASAKKDADTSQKTAASQKTTAKTKPVEVANKSSAKKDTKPKAGTRKEAKATT